VGKNGVGVKGTDYNRLDAMPSLFEEDFWRAFKTQQSERIAGKKGVKFKLNPPSIVLN